MANLLVSSSLIGATLFGIGLASPAQALSNRAWVSGHGTDVAGCGAPTSPCRSLQYVHDNIVGAGGEIDVQGVWMNGGGIAQTYGDNKIDGNPGGDVVPPGGLTSISPK